jgi:glycosyltransferase
MKITLITATFNSEKNICDCLQSVSCQTYKRIEHIIIDGASSDNTLEIIKTKSNHISKIISEPDKGIYDALNKGIRIATGDIIGFVHSDDILSSKDILTSILKSFTEEKADGVYGDILLVKRNDLNKIIRYWKSNPFNKKQLTYGWMPPHPTLFLKKEVYEKHGFFNVNFKISGDYEPTNINEWANEIGNELGFKIKIFPFLLFKYAALIGDLLNSIGIHFPMTSFRLNNMITNNVHELTNTKKIAPKLPFNRIEGIRETLEWLKYN